MHFTLPTLALGLSLALAPATNAQSPTEPANPRSATPLTATDLEAFLDGIVPLALKSNDITGTVIAVVKDGKLLLAKGYGFADRDRQLPVRPDSTLFRVASISKLFTATAAMQLVEQGKLDLDEEIDRYLDFAVPRKFPDKITLRHLLTHTAGFEEAFKKLPADSGKSVPLKEWVSKTTPAQLYRPGTVTSYSNYGTDLVGYIVEHTSGTPFAEYVRLHILDPLGMRQSSIAEPMPPALRAQLSREYPTASDSAGEFEVLFGEPSGNLSATAVDMTKFAIAHLALGRFDSIQILKPETARLMGTTQFRTHPRVPGMGLGFFEEDRNGLRILGHGGDLARFHSHLSLLMDHGVAFFVSVNSTGRGAAFYSLREAVRDAFLDRYFPNPVPLEPVLANAATVSAAHTGTYTLSRRGASTLGGVIALLINLDITANPDGSIQIGFVAGPNGLPMRWYPVDETTYRSEDGSQLLGYVPGSNGVPDRFGFLGGHELHRVGMLSSRSFNLALLIGSLSTFALSLLLWPVAGLIRRRYGAGRVDDGVSPRLRALTRWTALAALGFTVALGVFISRGFEGAINLDSRSDVWLGLIRLIGVAAIVGTVASIAALSRSFRLGRSGWARVKYFGLSAAGLAFSWIALHWNLVSWNFRY